MSRKPVLLVFISFFVITALISQTTSLQSLCNKQCLISQSGTIYIRANGSIDPPTVNITTTDNVTYTFTDNINDSIVIEKSNIIIDGNGYTLQGSGGGNGFYLYSISNVTIKNTNVRDFYYGIWLDYSSNNSIFGNNVTTNDEDGILLYGSSNNNIAGNNITNNLNGILLCYSSNNNSIAGNNITNIRYGIRLGDSSNNSIAGNNITNNNFGFFITDSSNNSIAGNNITNNLDCILFYGSSNNSIAGNNITGHRFGIRLSGSSNNNSIAGNNITNNGCGIRLGDRLYGSSNNNSIAGNSISGNANGISFYDSSENIIYHNNFINNTEQVRINGYSNAWDDGYPSGGNYWSDYTGVDVNGDGIGDTPYVIDENNTDRYPLMHPWSSLPVHNINTGSGYATIQEAINSNRTLDGHTILVDAGTYYEHITIDKSLCLIGEDRSTTFIDGNGTGNVVTVTKDSVNITGFTIRNSGGFPWLLSGLCLDNANHCNIAGNNIAANWYGIRLSSSSKNTICENNIAVNFYGIRLSSSSNNTLSGNNITNNGGGISLYWSSNNRLYHNNFIYNTYQVTFDDVFNNTWDNGVEGNYWSNYTGTDADHDGIGDSWHEGNENNTDHYPLMGMFNSYNTSVDYRVNVISNSTIGGFAYFGHNSTIRMYASNMTASQTYGFCRVCIPHALMDENNISVEIDDGATTPLYPDFNVYDNTTHRWIYFAYEHSTHEIDIIPEFPSLIITPLFMVAALLAVIVYNRKHFH